MTHVPYLVPAPGAAASVAQALGGELSQANLDPLVLLAECRCLAGQLGGAGVLAEQDLSDVAPGEVAIDAQDQQGLIVVGELGPDLGVDIASAGGLALRGVPDPGHGLLERRDLRDQDLAALASAPADPRGG